MHGDECRIAYPCTLKFTRFIMSGVEMKTTSKQVKIKRLYINML